MKDSMLPSTIAAFVLVLFLTTSLNAETVSQWELRYETGGGGLWLESPDDRFRFGQLGYLQFRADAFHPDFERADENVTFDIRRARLDWFFQVKDRYELLLEFDGGVGTATPGASDFALVIGRLSGPLTESTRWTVGKFITPFSRENRQSSRSLDTIERYIALNSLFLLPALDTQTGVMIETKWTQNGSLKSYFGAWNGNGRAADNLSDNNGEKEWQLKIQYRPTSFLDAGVALDYSHEEPQALQLTGYSFTPFSRLPVSGDRLIYGGHFHYDDGVFSWKAEGLYGDFADVDTTLAGGFVQPGYFWRGTRRQGIQWVLRLDYARIDAGGVSLNGDTVSAATLGVNWFLNGNVRVKLNAVGEHYSGPGNNVSPTSGVQGDGLKPYLLTELQVKF